MTHKTREGDDVIVYTRAEDRSWWMKSSFLLDKYKLLWIIGLALLTAFGFDFKTPKSTATELQVQIDTLKKQQARAAQEQAGINAKIDILLKVPCLDKKRNERDLQLIGVDCTPFPAY